CSHIEGMTSAHESLSREMVGRLEYPDDHIEVDNRLSWFLGSLERKNAAEENVFYVYLKRKPELVSKSYIQRWYIRPAVIRAFYHGILMRSNIPTDEEKEACGALLVKTMTDNIEVFLENKTNVV